MNISEYVTLVHQVRTDIYTSLRAALPNPACELEKRYILTGQTSDEDWVASLRNSTTNKIRIMVMLMTELPIGQLERTAGGSMFNPNINFIFELYHQYEMGTDAVNSENDFISDAARWQYALGGPGRRVGSQGVIENISMKLGIRPSKVQPMHYGRGSCMVQLRNLKYEALS